MLLPTDSDQTPLTQQVTMQIQNRIKPGIKLLAEIIGTFHAVTPMKKCNFYTKCMQVWPTSALPSSWNFTGWCQSLVSNADFCIICELKRFHKPKRALGQNLSCKIYLTNSREREEYQYQARKNISLKASMCCFLSNFVDFLFLISASFVRYKMDEKALRGFHLHKDLVSTPNQGGVATPLNTCINTP